MHNKTWNWAFIAAVLVTAMLCFGCSGSSISPLHPSEQNSGLDNNPPAKAPQGRLIAQASIGTEGGNVDIGWLTLEFTDGALLKDSTVKLYESTLSFPRKDAIIGGFPVRIIIDARDGDTASPLAENVGYRCIFHLNLLPKNDGDFSAGNRFVDISGEWRNRDGTPAKGLAWARRDGDTVRRVMLFNDVTLVLLDYSGIPELTAEPVLTDDPRELSGPYARYAEVNFNTNNLGPLAGRIPVVLIHGLQLDNMDDEPFDLNDTEAIYGEGGWIAFINALNGNSAIFSDFKFFWYCYPTGVSIFGANGSAAKLRQKLIERPRPNWDSPLENRVIVLVCHSMGGLVAREYVKDYSIYMPSPRIIAVATPHYGSPIVNVGNDLVDIPLFGWLDVFLTDGVMDLACDETIKYKWLGITFTASLKQNLNLRALNLGFPEDDYRLICYGDTRTQAPSPGMSDEHYLPLQVLKMVTSPAWLCESYKGYHSDCVVNWPSQFYTKAGDPDLGRNFPDYHMTVMSDPNVETMVLNDLYNIKSQF